MALIEILKYFTRIHMNGRLLVRLLPVAAAFGRSDEHGKYDACHEE